MDAPHRAITKKAQAKVTRLICFLNPVTIQ